MIIDNLLFPGLKLCGLTAYVSMNAIMMIVCAIFTNIGFVVIKAIRNLFNPSEKKELSTYEAKAVATGAEVEVIPVAEVTIENLAGVEESSLENENTNPSTIKSKVYKMSLENAENSGRIQDAMSLFRNYQSLFDRTLKKSNAPEEIKSQYKILPTEVSAWENTLRSCYIPERAEPFNTCNIPSLAVAAGSKHKSKKSIKKMKSKFKTTKKRINRGGGEDELPDLSEIDKKRDFKPQVGEEVPIKVWTLIHILYVSGVLKPVLALISSLHLQEAEDQVLINKFLKISHEYVSATDKDRVSDLPSGLEQYNEESGGKNKRKTKKLGSVRNKRKAIVQKKINKKSLNKKKKINKVTKKN